MAENAPLMGFTARVIPGAGHATPLGFPTMNVDLQDVPESLAHGIYAGIVAFPDGDAYGAALHYGPRHVHEKPVSFEAHVLDAQIPSPPARIAIEILGHIRPVRDFPDEASLHRAIEGDIAAARAMIAAHGPRA